MNKLASKARILNFTRAELGNEEEPKRGQKFINEL